MAPVLALALVLAAAGATVPPALPAPRDLARSVLETHGQPLRLLRLLGVSRTPFDWGTHFTINFTARRPVCPQTPERGSATTCQTRPGRVQRCIAQVSVFSFLPDVPLSMVECGHQPPGGITPSRPPSAQRALGTKRGHPSSSSRTPPGPPPSLSLLGTPRHPLSPAEQK